MKNKCFQLDWKSRWPGRQNMSASWMSFNGTKVIIIYQILTIPNLYSLMLDSGFGNCFQNSKCLACIHFLMDLLSTSQPITLNFVTIEYNLITAWTWLIMAKRELIKQHSVLLMRLDTHSQHLKYQTCWFFKKKTKQTQLSQFLADSSFDLDRIHSLLKLMCFS